MTTERIDIQVREDGSRVVSRNLDDIADSADGASDALTTLKGIVTGLLTGAALAKLAEYAGIWTDLNARVARFAGTVENTGAVMDRLMSIAQRTYAPLESTAEIYLENAFSLQQLGKSTAEALDYTEAMTNALVVSGAKGQRAEAVISALGKSMLEGKLKGDNWNTVLTQGGRIVEALTAETGKSLTELKQMASAGQLTSETVFSALVSQLDMLREEADAMPATIGDAFVRMRNRVIQVIGELDTQLGASQGVVKFIDMINENLDAIVPILASIAVSIVTAFAPGIIMAFAAQVRGLWLLIAAHPFVAVAAAIAGLVSYLYIMRDEIKLGIDETTTLGDLMRAVWESVGPAIQAVADLAATFFNWIGATSSGTFEGMINDIVGYEHESESMWLKLVRIVVQVFDMIGGTVRGVMHGVFNVVSSVIAALMNNFEQLGNAIQGALSLDGSAILDAAKANLEGWKNAGSNIGENFSKGFQEEVLRQDEAGLESWLDQWVSRAKEIGDERAKAAAAGAVDLTGKGPTPPPLVDPDAAKKAAKELERLKNELDRLIGSIDPVQGAMMDLAAAQDTFTRAVQKGLITQSEADRYMAKMKEDYADALDPLGALNDEIDRNISMLKMSSQQREIENQLYRDTEKLRRDGIVLTTTETDALRAKLVVEQELARIAAARDQMQASSGGQQLRDFQDQVTAMKELLAMGREGGGLGGGDVSGNLQSMLPWANLEGTQEQMAAYIQAHADMYAQIKMLEDESIINHQTAEMLKAQADLQYQEQRLSYQRKFFGLLAGLSSSSNRELAAIGKAAAITQATIDGVLAVQKTMAETPYPYNIPLAIAQGALAAANVAQIASQPTGFRTGGNMTVGGYGGTDSQLVAFRATPGEKVHVNTPAQARALEEGGGGQAPQVNQKIINLVDPSLLGQYLNTEEGEELVWNIIDRNPERVQALAGAG